VQQTFAVDGGNNQPQPNVPSCLYLSWWVCMPVCIFCMFQIEELTDIYCFIIENLRLTWKP